MHRRDVCVMRCLYFVPVHMILFDRPFLSMRFRPAPRFINEVLWKCFSRSITAASACVLNALLIGAGAQSAQAQGAYQDEPAQAATAGAVTPPAPFLNGCALCHGRDAKGTPIAPGLVNSAHVQAMSDDDIATMIKKGKGKMPP